MNDNILNEIEQFSPEPEEFPEKGKLYHWWKIIRGSNVVIKTCLVSLVIIIILIVFAPLIAPYNPNAQTLLSRLRPPLPFERSLAEHVLGTDQLGRDMLSRCIYGLRMSIGIALVGSLISLTIGVTLGTISGYFRGIPDSIIMGLVDVQIAFPFTLVALLAIAIFGGGKNLGVDLTVFVSIIGIANWEGYTRLVRGQVLSVREMPFVESAISVGASKPRIIFIHILPNIAASITIMWTLTVSTLILLESSLSFLGLGVQPPTATLGSMVGRGRDYLASHEWIAALPALLIMIVSLVILVLGDWLRDVLDKKLK